MCDIFSVSHIIFVGAKSGHFMCAVLREWHTFLIAEGNIMKLMIAGSRSITDFDISPYIPDDTEEIICGGAKGIDTLAEMYADKRKITKYVIRPDYARYKRGATIKRNERMVDYADKVIVFWDNVSRGTKHTIDYAQKTGKPIEVIIVSA